MVIILSEATRPSRRIFAQISLYAATLLQCPQTQNAKIPQFRFASLGMTSFLQKNKNVLQEKFSVAAYFLSFLSVF